MHQNITSNLHEKINYKHTSTCILKWDISTCKMNDVRVNYNEITQEK